jgi:hypothetical protein
MIDEDMRRKLVPVGQVPPVRPAWVVPGLLPPGLTFMVGDPKTCKSTLVLEIAASLDAGRQWHSSVPAPTRRGSLLYMAAEQGLGTLSSMYRQIVGEPVPPNRWGLILPRDVHSWMLDDLADLAEAVKPTVFVVDPLAQFHTLDENDAGFALALKPLKSVAMRHNFSVLIVHHTNKGKGEQGGGGSDWSRIRGTSALWGMADAGILLTKRTSGDVVIKCEYKDHPGREFTWRPTRLATADQAESEERGKAPKGSDRAAQSAGKKRRVRYAPKHAK